MDKIYDVIRIASVNTLDEFKVKMSEVEDYEQVFCAGTNQILFKVGNEIRAVAVDTVV